MGLCGGRRRLSAARGASKADLLEQLRRPRVLHQKDLTEGAGHVTLPDAIARKYPSAPIEWGWPFVFPASSRYFDRETNIERRHHMHQTVIQKALRNAAHQHRYTHVLNRSRLGVVSPADIT